MNFLPAPPDGGFRRDDLWIWCGSVVRGEDGRFHMFTSVWEKEAPFAPNWVTNSRIVRAVSDTPEGPYTLAQEILPRRGREHWDGMMTHNPTIHRAGGKYLLFYTGTTYGFDYPTAGITPAEYAEARGNQRIGLAVADAVEGPWARPDAACLGVRAGKWDAYLTTNPAPCVLADGSIHLLYKACPEPAGRIQYGVARAASHREPFERLGADAPITFHDPSISYEDAYIWQEAGLFHMIFNDMTGRLTGEDHAGAHAVSPDGIEWQLGEPAKAYSRQIAWADGSVTRQGSFERPQLLIQQGRPTHLFAATADGPGGFAHAANTWNMVVPLADS